MIPLKFKRFEIRKPRYNPNPQKSKTNNHNWRQGLFIIFEDYNGNEYDVMPTWAFADELNQFREKVENINKVLAQKFNKMDGAN